METISTFPGEALMPVDAGNPACPDISGRYGYGKSSLLSKFPKVGARNHTHIRIREEVIKGELIYSEWDPPVYYHDTGSFEKQSIVGVAQKGKELELTLMDKAGEPYKRVFVDLDNAAIGCRDGALVIRESDFTWGVDGRIGAAWATERQFRKLADGSLAVRIDRRKWYVSIYRGLIGIRPDYEPGGDEPRRDGWTPVFPAVK